MRTMNVDLWELHANGVPIVVTTNFTIKRNGCAVMGRGIALQAATRFPKLPAQVGHYNLLRMPVVYYPEWGLYTFAVKHNWWENADQDLIRASYRFLFNAVRHWDHDIAISRPGCGNGHLDWKRDVEPIFADILYQYRDIDDHIIFVP